MLGALIALLCTNETQLTPAGMVHDLRAIEEQIARAEYALDKDLMPDAFAYVVLAKLSIDKRREAALAACRARAKVKTICVLPSP